MTFSVVIPCFNQGRFLTDCLESIANQTVQPAEVTVVNDGSTDLETNEICATLSQSHFPFPVRSLIQANKGVSAARNLGIRHSTGAVILPLDADDKLLPHAIAEYLTAFQKRPEIDIVTPDIIGFGTHDFIYYASEPNRWRLLHSNTMACSSAMRRRIFDLGYWYDERVRSGVEDWEFYMRTCALGPFKAGALLKPVFAYRKWGYSASTGIRPETVLAQIRSLHSAAGIWSPERTRLLRAREAPTHRRVGADPRAAVGSDDMSIVLETELGEFLNTDRISRFLWFGRFSAEAIPCLQLIVNEWSRTNPASPLAFVDAENGHVYLVVLDRLTDLEAVTDSRFKAPALVAITTSGPRFPRALCAGEPKGISDQVATLLKPWHGLSSPSLLPQGHAHDPRVRYDVQYYFRREPAIPALTDRVRPDRTLVIVIPRLDCGSVPLALELLLRAPAFRKRFEKVIVITFAGGQQSANCRFELLCDAIADLESLGIDDERKVAVASGALEASQAGNLLILNSWHGCEVAFRIRQAKLPVWIAAQLHSFNDGQTPRQSESGFAELLASRYVSMIDRVASTSERLTSRLVELFYLPRHKVRTIRVRLDAAQFRPDGNGEDCYNRLQDLVARARDETDLAQSLDRFASDMINWSFPLGVEPRLDHLSSVFGIIREEGNRGREVPPEGASSPDPGHNQSTELPAGQEPQLGNTTTADDATERLHCLTAQIDQLRCLNQRLEMANETLAEQNRRLRKERAQAGNCTSDATRSCRDNEETSRRGPLRR